MTNFSLLEEATSSRNLASHCKWKFNEYFFLEAEAERDNLIQFSTQTTSGSQKNINTTNRTSNIKGLAPLLTVAWWTEPGTLFTSPALFPQRMRWKKRWEQHCGHSGGHGGHGLSKLETQLGSLCLWISLSLISTSTLLCLRCWKRRSTNLWPSGAAPWNLDCRTGFLFLLI